MKNYFNLRKKSKLLLLTLLAVFVGGVSPAWAQVTETFESVTLVEPDSWSRSGELSNGWICVNSSGVKNSAGLHESSDEYPYFIGTRANNGSKSLGSISSNSQSYYLVIPVLMSGDVTFSMCTNSTNSSTYGYVRIHKVSDNGDGTYSINSTAFSTQTKSGSSSYTWAEKTVSLGDEETMIAIRANRAFIDDFTYTPYVETGCKKPKSLSISNITSSSADFSWTKGDESDAAWQIVYSTDENFDKDAATPIDVNTTSYSFSELNPNTTYYVAVRTYAGSGEGEQSAWVTTSFKTEKVAVPATGFTDNFETNKGWELINGSCPNKWVIGTGTNNGGSKALYISQDGTSYASSSYGSSSLVYASMLLRFEAGDYTVSYDWMCNGEGTYDFMRVGLVPASVELTASTSYSNLGSGSTLPTGWSMWLDGGSKLGGSTSWATKSVDFTIETAGNYQVVFAWRNDYSGGSTPAAVDNFKILGSAPVLELSGDVVGTALAFGSVAETTNKTITITNSGKVAMENITLTETADADNVFAYSALPKTSLAANESMDVTVTFSGSSAKDYTGTFRVSADECDPIDITVTATYSNTPATLAVKLDEATVGEAVAFGSVGKQAVKTFTVTNDGDQTLNVTIASDNTTDFTVDPTTLAVTGHSNKTFTVTFVYPNESPELDVEKTANITVTPSNEGLAPKTFAVTGTRIEQWSEDFSGNTLPEGWENDNTTYWQFSDGVARSTYIYSPAYYLTTPSLVVEDGESLSFDVCLVESGSYRYLTVQKQKDNGSWESCMSISYSEFSNTADVWKTFTIDGLAAGNYKFRFQASGHKLDNFQGFKLNNDDPKFGFYTDPECTAVAAASETKDFGFVTVAPEAQVYYLKNGGTGTLTLALGDVPTGFTAVLGKASLGKGESTTLTINMSMETKGYRNGNIVVTAKNSSDTELGTFTVAASGVAIDENKLNINFATDNIPSTWTTNNWSKNDGGYIESGYASNPIALETVTLTAEANEDLVVVAKQTSGSYYYTFGVKYKKPSDTEWTDLIGATNIGTNWVTLHATIEEAGTYQLQFAGVYAQIKQIYGLAEAQEPVMAVYDGESLAGASYSFDNKSDENDATWTLTVKNEGKATLTGLAAALTGDNATHYSVEVSATELAVNATATVTVKQLKDNLGSHNATLTISADDPIEDKVITLSGFTYDHTKLFVDFDNPNAIPTGWTAGTSWSVYTSGDDRYAQQTNYSTASSLVTTPLTVAESETLIFQAARYNNYTAPVFKVRYTTDGGLTWSEYIDYADQITSSTFVNLELTGVPAGTAVVEFYGSYVKLDNIYGFTPTTAPMLALTESAAVVANGDTKAFGTLTAQATATYTLTNNGNGDMVSAVTTTGVATAVISGESEGVVISENTVTLAAGKSATITLTLPYEAPYGEKSGAMTITTEGWVGDFTVNYTATTVDPTALYEDFASNAKPTGWYQEASGWLFTQGTAHVYTGVDKVIITEKYGAEEGKNVLSFDAKLQSTSADGELKVYTSTNRKDWTLEKTVTLTAENQIVTLDALDDGEYYVKFVSLNASIDNLTGLKKLTAPEHDLFFVSINVPEGSYVPGSDYTATVNVVNLRAASETVAAELYIKNEKAGELEKAKVIALNTTETITLTGTVPEEGKHLAYVKVYNDDITIETEPVTFTSVHNRTLEITEFTRTSEAAVTADGENKFTATFDVKVKNTGTAELTAEQVRVTITDAEGNPYQSANATATLDVDGETTISVTVTTSALEGGEFVFKAQEEVSGTVFATTQSVTVTAAAPKFALYQNATPVNDGDDVQFGLTKTWKTLTFNVANEGNKVMEVLPATPAGFDFWEKTSAQATETDSEWSLYFYKESVIDADQGTFKTTDKENIFILNNLALAQSEGVSFSVHNSNWSTQYGWKSAGVNATATAVELAEATSATGWLQLPDGNYDVIWNTGDHTITFKKAGAFLVAADENAEVDVTLRAEQGKVSGNLTFTYAVDATTNKTFTLALSGRSQKKGEWFEDFEATAAPTGWEADTDYWTFADGVVKGKYNSNSRNNYLTTPTLTVAAGETMSFDYTTTGNYVNIPVSYSKEGGEWTTYAGSLSNLNNGVSGTIEVEGLEAGDYRFRFGNDDYNLDNFVGFTLHLADHIMAITASNIPTSSSYSPTMKATKSFDATVTVKENRGVNEENVVAKLYMGEEMIGTSEVVNFEANESKTITITATPTKAATEGAQMYIEVTYAGGTLKTEAVTRYVAEFVTLDLTETAEVEIETGNSVIYDQVTLTHSFAEGWNTFVAPLAVNMSEFGEGAKAYSFTDYANTDYANGVLKFSVVTSASLNPATPYIIYVPTAIVEKVFTWDSPIIYSTYVGVDNIKTTQNGATFQGTYAPIAAPGMQGKYGVTNEAKIAKGSDKASMKGFRAYFELPNGASARLAFTDEDGTTTIINAIELDKQNGEVYNLNGQRVEGMKKGLYIINGKKVVRK